MRRLRSLLSLRAFAASALLVLVAGAWPWGATTFQRRQGCFSQYERAWPGYDCRNAPLIYRSSNGQFWAWNWSTGKRWRVPQPQGPWTGFVQVNGTPRGDLLVFIDKSRVVSMVDIARGRKGGEFQLPPELEGARLVAVTPTLGKLAFTAGADPLIRMVIVELRLPVNDSWPHGDAVATVRGEHHRFTDHERIARWIQRTVDLEGEAWARTDWRLFDSGGTPSRRRWLASGRAERYEPLRYRWTDPPQGRFAEALRTAVSSDRLSTTYGGSHELRIVDERQRPVSQCRTTGKVAHAAFTGDGKYLVTEDHLSNFQVFETATGKLVAENSQTKQLWWFCFWTSGLAWLAAAIAATSAIRSNGAFWSVVDATLAGTLVAVGMMCVNRDAVSHALYGFALGVGILVNAYEGEAGNRLAAAAGATAFAWGVAMMPVGAMFLADDYSLLDRLPPAAISTFAYMLLYFLAGWVVTMLAAILGWRLSRDESAWAAMFQFEIQTLMWYIAWIAAGLAVLREFSPERTFGGRELSDVRVAIGAATGLAIFLAVAWFRGTTWWLRLIVALSTLLVACAFLGAEYKWRPMALTMLWSLNGAFINSHGPEPAYPAIPVAATCVPMFVARMRGYRWIRLRPRAPTSVPLARRG